MLENGHRDNLVQTIIARRADDHALARLMAYLKYHDDLGLVGDLAPEDTHGLVLRIWPDADWGGRTDTAKSRGGLSPVAQSQDWSLLPHHLESCAADRHRVVER